MRTDEDDLDLAYAAAEELETVVSGLSWNLMTPPERQDVIAVLEQLSRYFRGIDRATFDRVDKLAAVEPGVVQSGDGIIDLILADPCGMRPADARRIVDAGDTFVSGMKLARAEEQRGAAWAGHREAGTHSDPPACYVRAARP